MTPSEAALEAARLISVQGLAKGALQDDEGRLCHNGAVYLAATGSASALACQGDDSVYLALEVIGRSSLILEREGTSTLPHMVNDEQGTSAEDIILLLKENAALDDDPEALAEIARRREAGMYNSIPVLIPPAFLAASSKWGILAC